MGRQILARSCRYLLIAGLLLASVWAYWYEQPSGEGWVVEQPEQIISYAVVGEELRVAFKLRNTSSMPRRLLGFEAC
jgi:hypothetical protein